MIRALCLSALLAAPALAQDAPRIFTPGGSVTEIAVAPGAGDRLVARDTTSTFPETILALPDVGHIRALSPENILALDPALIMAEGDAGPPEAVDVLKSAGIPFILVPEATDPQGISAKTAAVAQALDLTEQGRSMPPRYSPNLTPSPPPPLRSPARSASCSSCR